MTKYQAEQLYALFAKPEWKAFIEYKKDKLSKMHEQLEWEEVNIKKVQGQISEIKDDLKLQQTILSYLDSDTAAEP